MTLLRRFGVAYLAAILCVLGFHLAAGDRLVFASDFVSLAIYVGVTALVLASVFFAVSLPLALLPDRITRAAHGTLIGLLLAGLIVVFFAFAVAALMERVHFGVLLAPYFGLDFLEQVKSLLIRSAPWAVLLALAAVFVFRRRYLAYCWQIRPRLERLSTVVLLGAVLLIPSLYGFQLLSTPAASAHSGSDRHLVLVVLDAMPAQFLRTYNDTAERTALDDVLREGRVFTQVRTIAPYTYAYFGTLYSGRLDGRAGRDNLMSRLQRAGVETRWMSHHRNGFPDGSKAHATAYRGLRSHFLTPRTAWIPEALGLSYHVDLSGRYVVNPLVRWAVGPFVLDDLLDDRATFRAALLPQVREIQADAQQSFLIFHVAHTSFHIDGPEVRSPQLGDAKPMSDRVSAIHENDYRYSPADEELAAGMRNAERKYAEAIGRQLRNFLQELKAAGLERTAVIVTSDHGTMFSKGRFWYGYHPNGEVLRVPFAVFNAEEAGIDARLFDTRDISATILDYFGLPSDLTDEPALSVLREGEGRDWVGSLTMRSDKHRGWYLVLYHRSGVKYRINLHPEASDRLSRFRVDGYTQMPLDGRAALDDAVPAVARDFVRRFGLDENTARVPAPRH